MSWKEKTEYVAGIKLPNILDADWAQIYHRVVDLMAYLAQGLGEENNILSPVYIDALNDLATLQVFLLIHPAEKMDPKINVFGDFEINSLLSLQWLFENGYLIENQSLLKHLLESAARTDSVEIVKCGS